VAFDINAGSWTTAQLLASIRRSANLPDTASDWTDAVLLEEASQVIQWFATWALTTVGDGRLVGMFSRNVSAALGDAYGASRFFLLPPHAVGDTINSAVWVTATGREKPLVRVDPHDQHNWDTPDSSGEASAYVLLADGIRILPQPTQGGLLRFNYQRRHPDLIADTASDVSTISSVADLGDGFTRFNTSAGPTYTPGSYVDLISNQFPYRCIHTMLYVDASTGATVDVFLPYSYVSSLSLAGCRLVMAGRSPYVHLPLEMKTAIQDKTAASVMRKIGDLTGAASAESSATSSMQLVMNILDPRTRDQRRKVMAPNSVMRRRMWNR
jgi:hypothetical protein